MRPTPYFPSMEDLDAWQPSVRREIPAPLLALIATVIAIVDSFLHDLHAVGYLNLVYGALALLLATHAMLDVTQVGGPRASLQSHR